MPSWAFDAAAAVYPWTLPVLADIGFAKTTDTTHTSISQYIDAGPPAALMVLLSLVPIYRFVVFGRSREDVSVVARRALTTTQWLFLASYVVFLVCTPSLHEGLHIAAVTTFTAAFLAHALLICKYVAPSTAGRALLFAGSGGAVAMVLTTSRSGYVFWLCECVGFTAMVLFTPVEIYFTKTPPPSTELRFDRLLWGVASTGSTLQQSTSW